LISRRTLDVLVAVWVLAWLLLGIAAGRELRGIAEVTDSARDAGLATQRAGELLESLSGVPLVGPSVGESAATIQQAGRSTVEGAERGRERAERLGTLAGAAIALVPSLPLLVFYLPGRITLHRERERLRDLLARDDPALDELLAARGVANLPYAELLAISTDPTADLREGNHRPLADAELARLELSRPARAR